MNNTENITCPNCGESERYKLIIDNHFGRLHRFYCTTCKVVTYAKENENKITANADNIK